MICFIDKQGESYKAILRYLHTNIIVITKTFPVHCIQFLYYSGIRVLLSFSVNRDYYGYSL